MKPQTPKHQVGRRAGLGLLLLALLPQSARCQGIPIPDDSWVTEGNSSLSYPFNEAGLGYTMRYQQVYDASQFTAVSNGGWIFWLSFRANGGSGVFGALVSNVVIHLSTTTRHPDGLSPTFSENVGGDDELVFSGSFVTGGSGAYPPPERFDFGVDWITLSKYFWYDPRLGNLLLDVRSDPHILAPLPPMDAVDTVGDGISSVFASPMDAPSGSTNTVGLVTLITFAPVPTLKGYISDFGTGTNYIAIRWLYQPTNFVLQQASSLASNAIWQSLPGVGGSNVVFKEYRIPVASAGPKAYFRLVWPGGQ